MDSNDLRMLLRELGACGEARAWTKRKSLAEAWEQSERADWMLWLCGRMCGKDGWPTRQQIVLVACSCAETVLPIFEKKYPSDDRPRKAIEAARAWAQSGGDIEEVRKARRAAAADAAAAAYAAAAAAYAAYAAAAAAAAYAAYAAAAAAAYAAYAAAAADAAAAAAYAYAAARASANKSMCELIRKELKIPNARTEVAQ